LIDSQKVDFAVFKMRKHTNLDIKDAASIHIVHNLQHPTSHPTANSTQTTTIKAPKKNISAPVAAQYGKLAKQSTQQCHQANESMSSMEAERVRVLGAEHSLQLKKKLAAKKR
jgi:hypothetical protein